MSVHDESSGRKRRSKIVSRADSRSKGECPVCGEKTSNCSATSDGMYMCRVADKTGPAPDGWIRLWGDDNTEFAGYRRAGDTRTGDESGEVAPADPVYWEAIAQGYVPNKIGVQSRRLALLRALGLPPVEVGARVFDAFPLLGFDPVRNALTVPMYDAHGRATGLYWRSGPKERGILKGGQAGMFTPVGWHAKPGQVLFVEGFTDTLAMTATGLRVIGRHSAGSDPEPYIALLSPLPPGTEVLVVGHNDQKGRDGAERFAQHLAEHTRCRVSWALPPHGFKDVREWLTAPGWGELPWTDRGAGLLNHLTAHAVAVDPPQDDPANGGDEVVLKCVGDYQVGSVKWLVPYRIPRGKLVVGAGDGATGKSTTTRHLAAKVSAGDAALGVAYTPDGPGDVIFLANEDDYGDTVLPDLIAEGADVNRIYHIPYVSRVVGGKRAEIPFGPEHIDLLKLKLRELPQTKLIVIDPVASFIGGSGINDHKANELRALVLDPLTRLAAEFDVTVLLIAHFSKGQVTKAVHKIAGSAAYSTGVRLVYGFETDEDDAALRLMIPLKTNVRGLDRTAVRFRQTPLSAEEKQQFIHHPKFRAVIADGDFDAVTRHMARLVFDEPVEVNADDVFCPGAQRAEKKLTIVNQCGAWLLQFLGEFSWPDGEVLTAAGMAGFTPDNVKKAKAQLRQAAPPLCSKPRGKGGEWWNWIGTRENPNPDRPHDSAPKSPDTPETPHSPDTPETGNAFVTPVWGESGVSGDLGDSGVSGGSDVGVSRLFAQLDPEMVRRAIEAAVSRPLPADE